VLFAPRDIIIASAHRIFARNGIFFSPLIISVRVGMRARHALSNCAGLSGSRLSDITLDVDQAASYGVAYINKGALTSARRQHIGSVRMKSSSGIEINGRRRQIHSTLSRSYRS